MLQLDVAKQGVQGVNPHVQAVLNRLFLCLLLDFTRIRLKFRCMPLSVQLGECQNANQATSLMWNSLLQTSDFLKMNKNTYVEEEVCIFII